MTSTVATVWAHYDDDLLFANPTIDRALASGDRVRSLFLTASDAGTGMSEYAAHRERGIRAAYDVMLGAPARWVDRVETLATGLAVTITAPAEDPRVALAFLRLPDGGLSGRGWYPTGYQTLPKLLGGEIPTLRALGTGQEVTVDLLVSSIGAFVAAADAGNVLAPLPAFAVASVHDHPDHGATGALVAAAVDARLVDSALVRYAVGYDGSERASNLSPEVVDRKIDVFAAYAAHDAVLARDRDAYLALPGFGASLERQYLVRDADVPRTRP